MMADRLHSIDLMCGLASRTFTGKLHAGHLGSAAEIAGISVTCTASSSHAEALTQSVQQTM